MSANLSFVKPVIEYLKKERIPLDVKEFEYQLQSHPGYPSLIAVTDTLSYFNISTLPYKFSFENLSLLPSRFLAFLKSGFSLIETEDDVIRKNGLIISEDSLKEQWHDIVLIIEETEIDSVETNSQSRFNYALLTFLGSFIALILLIHYKAGLHQVLLIASAFAGLVIAIETVKQSLGIHSMLTSKLCSGTGNNDCTTVVGSKKWRLLQVINLSDVCVIFFSVEIAALSLSSVIRIEELLAWLFTIGLHLVFPVVTVSIYYQARIEKKWCALCLITSGVLLFQYFLTRRSTTISSDQITNYQIVAFLILLTGIAALWYAVKPILLTFKDLKSSQLRTLRFRRDFEAFHGHLKKQKFLVDQSTADSFLFGNKQSTLKINIVTSPFCGYCNEVDHIVYRLLQKFGDSICISMRFNKNPELFLEGGELVYQNLARIYFDEGPGAFLEALRSWFFYKERNRNTWLRKYVKADYIQAYDEILVSQWKWVKSNNVNFTPAIFIGDCLYPGTYEKTDLEYFIPDLIEESRRENNVGMPEISLQL